MARRLVLTRAIAANIVIPLLAGSIATSPALGQSSAQNIAAPAIPGMTSHFVFKTSDGRDVTEASFPGKWLVIYFGYTHCPDACPTALNAIGSALAELGPRATKLQPLFITLDPQRDSAQVMADYVKAFDPRMLGLSGTEAQTAAAAKAFHVYYAVRRLGHDEYAIDHSSFIYLVDPDHQVVDLLTGNLPSAAIAAALRHLIK
jgi:protein SCO1